MNETPSPDPTATPAPVEQPDPRPAATNAVPSKEILVGRWSLDVAFNYDLAADGTFSLTYGRDPASKPDTIGTWMIQDDGTVELTSAGKSMLTARVFGETLLVGVSNNSRSESQTFLRKMGPDGTPLPVVTASNPNSMPLFDAATATQVQFNLSWTGLSPLAPIVNQSVLTLTNDTFEGTAHLEAAGYRTGVSDTVAISVPASAMTTFLTALANTPVVSETYRPYFSHTDDYPSLEIRIQTGGHVVTFSTTSQGPTNVPWAIDVDGQKYVSYSDDIVAALNEIQPFLAKDAQQQLLDKVRNGS